MQSFFVTYLELGFKHIADLAGYDHILFITALCAIYRPAEWRRVAILVTAFTIGHSITLALAALNIIPTNPRWIEFLIPVTILFTAFYNVLIYRPQAGRSPQLPGNYFFALLFGLIHGMGFSNFFRALSQGANDPKFIQQLLAFNLGVELGQLVIVGVLLLLAGLVLNGLRIAQREWNLFISGAAAGLALVMALERLPWLGE